jgi:hypothetical protein
VAVFSPCVFNVPGREIGFFSRVGEAEEDGKNYEWTEFSDHRSGVAEIGNNSSHYYS